MYDGNTARINVAFFPEQQKNVMMKAFGIKLIEDFNNENYSKFFAIERIVLDSAYHTLEVSLFDPQRQKMINKVEKAFLICTKTFSHGWVITLELNPVLNQHFLCEAGLRFHSNFGSVHHYSVYERLKEVVLTLQRK